MKAVWKRSPGLHIWLSCLAAFFVSFAIVRQNHVDVNGLCQRILLPWEQWLGELCDCVSVSVAEVLIITLLVGAFFALTWWIRRLIATRFNGRVIYRGILIAGCVSLTAWAGFCLLWTPFYSAESFQEKSGIVARGGTIEELGKLTAQFAIELCDCADTVPRDENGCFAVPRQEILAQAARSYDGLYREFPFLKLSARTPKAFATSRVLSAMNFTGFYFPFTGEANVNVDSPAAYLPATICHEMAHQRGIASEQECNFLGVLAAIRSDNEAYQYSGYLEGYTYLSNALYRIDQNAWQAIRDSLPEAVLSDLRANTLYWRQFEGPVKQTAQRVYNGFLKINGDALGILSYGTMVDLLLAYYG